MRIKQLSTRAVMLLVLSAAFIWPALWNHGPFVFPDTRTYLRAAEAPANTLMHKKALQPEAEEVSGTMADSRLQRHLSRPREIKALRPAAV